MRYHPHGYGVLLAATLGLAIWLTAAALAARSLL